MRTKGLVAMAGLALWYGLGLATAPTDQSKPVDELMKEKLAHAQKAYEGLMRGEFDLIAKNARALCVLSQAASWQVYQTAEYREYSSEFQRLTRQLEQKASEKNLDETALAYTQLTINCVNCHKHARVTQEARFKSVPPRRP